VGWNDIHTKFNENPSVCSDIIIGETDGYDDTVRHYAVKKED